MLKLIKNWTLPLAMLTGVLGYFAFSGIPLLAPTKPFMNVLISYLTPFLIFAQLLLTFCKMNPKELLPTAWHGWLLLFQLVSTSVVAACILFFHAEGTLSHSFLSFANHAGVDCAKNGACVPRIPYS